MPRRCQLGIKSCARTVGLDLYIANRHFCHPPFDLRILLTHTKEPFSRVGFFWFIIRREALLALFPVFRFGPSSLSDWPRGNRKAKGWICVFTISKRKYRQAYPEIGIGQTVRAEIPTVRFEARPDIFAPRPSACHDHHSQSGGSVHREAHSRRHSPRRRRVRSHTLREESSSLARSSRPASPRSASGATMAATAMGGASVVGAPKFLPRAPGGRCAAPPRCAARLAPRPRGGPSRPLPARRPARPPKVRTRRPVTRAHSPPAPPRTRSPSFRFFSRPALSTRAARPVHSRF